MITQNHILWMKSRIKFVSQRIILFLFSIFLFFLVIMMINSSLSCSGQVILECRTDSDCLPSKRLCVGALCRQCRDDTDCFGGRCQGGYCSSPLIEKTPEEATPFESVEKEKEPIVEERVVEESFEVSEISKEEHLGDASSISDDLEALKESSEALKESISEEHISKEDEDVKE